MTKRSQTLRPPRTPPNHLVDQKAGLRWLLSLLILVHLVAIFAEPIRFFTRSSNGRPSAAFEPIRSWLSPYVEFAYLNHGYFFFAPNPGPSHLMDCQMIGDGDVEHRLRLPNLKAQWPRLLYHRHFMLAEFLNNLFTINEPPPDVEPRSPIFAEWQRSLETYRSVMASMEKHLQHKFGAEIVRIRRVEHRWPTEFEFFEQKWKINDERLYLLLPESPAQIAEGALPPIVLPSNSESNAAPLPRIEEIPGSVQGPRP